MAQLYILFKFVHVAAVIVWMGGAAALTLLNLRVATLQDRQTQADLAELSSFYGRAVLGPAAALTLVAGVLTAGVGGLDFSTFWITWGFAGIAGSILLGAIPVRRATAALAAYAGAGAAGDADRQAAQRQLMAWSLANLALLLSVVWAMVFKPSL
jgi:uncharacterized membrane protein